MRVIDEIKEMGFFWLPENPETQLPGFLSILDGGIIELEVLGLFHESPEGMTRLLNGLNDSHEIIHGYLEKQGPITLEDCYSDRGQIRLGQGISKQSFIINRAFFRIHCAEKINLQFDSFNFSVDGLDEWIRISGCKVRHYKDSMKKDLVYEPPEEVLISLADIEMTIAITFSVTTPIGPNVRENKISQKAYFSLRSDRTRHIDDFISVAHKVATLIGFASDQNVCIDYAHAKSISEEPTLKKIKIFYQSTLYQESSPSINSHQMLFTFPSIKNNAEKIFSRWFQAYETIDPALNLFFSARLGAFKYINSRFLALAQVLETLHRRTSDEKNMHDDEYQSLVDVLVDACPQDKKEWFKTRLQYANEIGFRTRIKRLLKPLEKFFKNINVKDFADKIVTQRNYLTHYDKKLEARCLSGAELWKLIQKIEAVFQLQLLQMIGFSEKEIFDVCKTNNHLAVKLS